MEEPPVYKEVTECEDCDASELVGSESHEFTELLLALSYLVLLDFLLSFVLKPLDYLFLNCKSFLNLFAA